MPGTLDLDGNDYSVYGSEAEAKVYFAASINSENWNSSDPNRRKKAQVSATRNFNRQRWEGTITVPGQVLAWPRTGVTDLEGVAVDENTIPVEVEEASYELALSFLTDATVEESTNSGSNLKRVKAGSAEVEFFKPTKGTRFPSKVQELLRPFIASNVSLTGTVSGCDEVTGFDPDAYDLHRGYA